MALLDLPLLRSIIDFGSDPQVELLQNLTALRNDVVPEGVDAHLVTFVSALADKSGHVPSLALVEQHYDQLASQGNTYGFTGQTRLFELKNAGLPFQPPASYQYTLDSFRQRTLGDGLATLIQQATAVLTTGHTIQAPRGKQTLQGPADAVKFVEAGLQALIGQFRTGAIEGDFLTDAADIAARYAKRKGAPVTGLTLGFEAIDKFHGPMQPGDLALVLGYTGQQKSTFTLNVAYNWVVFQGRNVAYVPLEMTAAALHDAFACIHCLHEKFQPTLVTVPYDRVRTGKLTPDEERLFLKAVDDLKHCPDYGRFLYKEPDKADVTIGDIFRWAEIKDRTAPLDALVVDYMALANPSTGGSAMVESALANVMVRETKQRAKAFRGGHGLVVMSPWQSNRKGYQDAVKNGGRYDLPAMAWAPEAEKSADLVYSVFQDDSMREAKTLLVGNLKARDRQKIDDLIELYCNPGLRVIRTPDLTDPLQEPVSGLQGAA